MAQELVLTFETFTNLQDYADVAYFDNFPLFFAKGDLGEYYRTLRPYEELKKEAPDLEKRLRDGISMLPHLSASTLTPFYKDLYGAYLIMRKSVTSDTDLGLPVVLPK